MRVKLGGRWMKGCEPSLSNVLNNHAIGFFGKILLYSYNSCAKFIIPLESCGVLGSLLGPRPEQLISKHTNVLHERIHVVVRRYTTTVDVFGVCFDYLELFFLLVVPLILPLFQRLGHVPEVLVTISDAIIQVKLDRGVNNLGR
jgi:hypothetical protein